MITKIKNIIFLLLLLTELGFAQTIPAPYLESPVDNSNYIQTNKLTLSWLKVGEEESYKIQYSLDSNFIPSSIEENIVYNRTTVTVTGLENNSLYFWRVKVDKDSAAWSEVWRFTTTDNPVVPNLISPSNNANNQTLSLFFAWSYNPVNVKYNLQISTLSDFSDTLRLIETTDTLIEVSGFKNNSNYFWRIKSFNIDQRSSNWSAGFEFRTQLATPTPLYPGNYTNNVDTSLALRWQDVSTASNFKVLLSTDNLFENESEIITGNLLTNKWEIDSLKTNTLYFWKVLATNAFGDSSSWSDVYRFKTKLSSPSLTFPSDSSTNINNRLTFKWENSSDFDSYNIQVATDKYFNNILIEEEVTRDSLFAELENYTTYYWRVSGKNNLGDISNWSKSYQFKTNLAKPTLISPANNGYFISDNYNFIWNNVVGAEEYRFQISESSDYQQALYNFPTTDSSIVLDSLSLNNQYYWRVLAFNNIGDSSNWSDSYVLQTTTIVVESDSINNILDFSFNLTDTIGTVKIHNFGNSDAKFKSIFAYPDSLFSTNVSEIIIPKGLDKSIIILMDTAKVDTGFYYGTLVIVPDASLPSQDTIRIPITSYALKAMGTIGSDSLNYDSLFVSSKKVMDFFLSNAKGNNALQINSYHFIGSDSTAFRLTSLPQNILPGDSSKIEIEFSPTLLDSNRSILALETNSYPQKSFEIVLTGIGKGGNFDEATINSLLKLSEIKFETLTNNNKEILFKNNGNCEIRFTVGSIENYFRILENSSIHLAPGDSATITLHYVTPNFDTLNIDTLKIYHNAFGENPLSITLSGRYDSLLTSKVITENLFVNNELFTNTDYLFEENKSITFSLKNNILSEQNNLEFKINYFVGGPGKKLTAVKSGTDKYTIPYQNVTNNGLVFKAELFTKEPFNNEIDSTSIFDLTNGQVIFENYSTPLISVPKSTAGYSANEAISKWVMFGFPFDNVVADSVFSNFGGITNMEDGEWIVYSYNNDLDGFKQFNNYSFNSGKGYFVAQSVRNSFDISYTYNGQLKSRKLTNNKIVLENSGNWNTISNPYTFPIEIDTPAVLYKYDPNNLRYNLTSIMRPGEAYFVEPTISELTVKTFGEYYPELFPTLNKNLTWDITALFEGENESDQVVVALLNAEKENLSKTNYLNPPNITNGLDVYITLENEANKYFADFAFNLEGAVWEIHVQNNRKDDFVTVSILPSENFPKDFTAILLDETNTPIKTVVLARGKERTLKLVVGTNQFIKEALENLENNIPDNYELFQNYPNPFNPSTVIKYSIPINENRESSIVRLRVYDLLGREIATLVNKEQKAGNYEVSFDASNLTSGIYFYKLEAGNFVESKKMLLLK